MSKRSKAGDDDDDHGNGSVAPPEKRSKITTNNLDVHAPASTSVNRYIGWTVPCKNYELPAINIASITPESFYKDYVKRRRPVVLNGIPPDVSQIEKWKDISYLDQKVGDHSVTVERRASAADSFGRGNEISMSFKKFLQLVKEGDGMHYLTTQDVRANADGRPELMSPLMEGLRADFPLRPALAGNLVPQNVNLWMGNNAEGASSGLHHDYHDNLYVVLRGRKRFRLFSPRDVDKMYTRGTLLTVHPNGRINYAGEETTAYGADVRSDAAAAAARRKDEAEKRLQTAEIAAKEGAPGAQEELELAEEELELAMDAILDAEMGDAEDDESETGESDEHYGGDEPRLVDKTVKNPNNFSRVDADMLDDEEKLKQQHPHMLEASAAFCDVEAGSMLYLPASWFHEVTSYGVAGGHLAMNYWFHPPDGDSFDVPYSTDFWPNDYRARCEDEQ